MTCTFDYIESSGVSESKKAFLTKLHIDTMKEIASAVHSDDPGNLLFDVPAYKNGNKILALQKFRDTDKTSKKFRKQISFLEGMEEKVRRILLAEFGETVDQGSKSVSYTDIVLNPEKNDSVSTIVTVNFAAYLDNATPINVGELDFTDPENLKTFEQLYSANLLKADFIDSRNATIEKLQNSESAEATLANLDKMMNSIDTLKENIFNNKNLDSKFASQEDDLEKMYISLRALKNLENNPARIFAITQYVAKSFKILTEIERTVKLDLEPRVNFKGERTPQEAGTALREASAYLTEIYSLLEAIIPLENILASVSKNIGVSFWQSYNELAIERQLLNNKDFLIPNKIKKEDIESVLNSEITNILEFEAGLRNKGLTEAQIKSASKIVSNNKLASKHYIAEAFSGLSSTMTSLKANITNLSHETIAGQLYNQQLISMGVKSKEELTDPELIKAFQTKSQLMQQLQVAAKDITWWNKWTAGGSQIDDVVVRHIVQDLRNALNTASIENTKISTNSEQHLDSVGLGLKDDTRQSWEKEFRKQILYLPPDATLAEVDEDYTGEFIEQYGKKFKVRKGNALIDTTVGAFDGYQISLDSRIHRYTVAERAGIIVGLVGKQNFLSDLPAHIYKDLKTLEKEGVVSIILGKNAAGNTIISVKDESYNVINPDEIAKSLNIAFSKSTNSIKTNLEIDEILENILSEYSIKNMLTELNKKESSGFYNYMKKNTTRIFTPETELSPKRMERLLGNSLTSSKSVIGLNENDEFIEVKFKKVDNEEYGREWVSYRIETPGVVKLIQLKGDFNNINERYLNKEGIALRNKMTSSFQKQAHYDFIFKSYKKSQENLGVSALPYNLLPFVPTEETETLWEKIKKTSFKSVIKDAWNGLKYEEKNVRVKKKRNEETGEYEMVDAEGNPTTTPVYIQKTDKDGHELLELTPKYVDPINSDEVETDLFLSMVLLETSSNSYRLMAEREATVNVVKTILKGNNPIGIAARRSEKQSPSTGNALQSTTNQVATTLALNSSEALISVMDDLVYGSRGGADSSFAGISVKKAIASLKGLTVFQGMALNVTASITNLGMGTISNFIAAAGKRLGLSVKIMRKSYSEYFENIPNFIADFAKEYKKDQSKWTQFATLADAIKGAVEGNKDKIETANISKKIGRNLLYLTSIAPEHMNQMTVFMAFAKSHPILQGLTMEDILEGGSGTPISFNVGKYNAKAKELGLPEIQDEEFDEKVLIPFRNKLGRIMYEAHGQFDKIDANMLEKSRVISLAYMFHRWVAPGIKARFGEGGIYSPQINEVEQEGYLLTYLKDMVFRNDAMMAEYENLAFVEKVKKYWKDNDLTTLAQISATALGKTTIGIINKMSFNLLSENSPQLEEWLFGDKTDKVRDRLERAYTEIAIYATIFVLKTVLESLADDDDEDLALKKIALLQLKRISSDMGFFLNPITYSDKVKLKLQDPFSIRRSYETNSGFLKQLIGWDIEDGKLDFAFNDLYERGGSGYEKGDSKLSVKFRKSALAPYHQMIKFLNPQQSLNFMDMTFNN